MLGYIRELNTLNTSLRIIVVLNLDCNLACTYCFEGQRKGKWYLSDETADAFIAFVKNRDLTGKKAIEVTFYGGEPLLSIGRVSSASRNSSGPMRRKKACRYEFGLVTNGTLLTPEVVRKLAPLGLKGAKVTLDGPEEIHDRFRPFRSGTGSFDVILRNIADVCELIRIQIGGNYTQDITANSRSCFDHLQLRRDLRRTRSRWSSSTRSCRKAASSGRRIFTTDAHPSMSPGSARPRCILRAEVLKRGYHTQKIMPSPCLLEFDDSFVVNYDGTLVQMPRPDRQEANAAWAT